MVEMNPAEAIAANLARLSYNASLRARAALRRAAARLTVGQVIICYVSNKPKYSGCLKTGLGRISDSSKWKSPYF